MPPPSAAPLLAKLQLRPDMRGAVLSAPDGVDPTLGLPPDMLSGEGRDLDFVVAFRPDARAVEADGPRAAGMVRADGVLWFCYPKGARLGADINRDRGWEPVTALGLRGVRQVAIDGTWSDVRFRHRETSQRLQPPA